MNRFFLSANGYYEVDTEDYEDCITRSVNEDEWQKFADRLGEEFLKIEDVDEDEYEDAWNKAHQVVCDELDFFEK